MSELIKYDQFSERWKEFKGDSWRSTIIEQRDRIAQRLRKSPGLKSILSELTHEAYLDARDLAAKETGLSINLFPLDCPFTQREILDDEFSPKRKIRAKLRNKQTSPEPLFARSPRSSRRWQGRWTPNRLLCHPFS